MEFLLFQLYGPMGAWGDVAVGEQRPSDVQPSKSAILGLAAAALGIRRSEESTHAAMAAGYGFSVLVLEPGELLRDYHSVQVPPETALRKRRPATRRDELLTLEAYRRDSASASGTLLSTREYRMDALYRVALWIAGSDAPFPLRELAQAFERPRFTLYLGRKACPPTLPLQPQVLDAPDLPAAYRNAHFVGPAEFVDWTPPGWKRARMASCHWDASEDVGLEPQQTIIRHDRIRSRQRWQFSEREEHRAAIDPGGDDVH